MVLNKLVDISYSLSVLSERVAGLSRRLDKMEKNHDASHKKQLILPDRAILRRDFDLPVDNYADLVRLDNTLQTAELFSQLVRGCLIKVYHWYSQLRFILNQIRSSIAK